MSTQFVRLNFFQKVWHKLWKQIGRRGTFAERANELQSRRSEVEAFFGKSTAVNQYIDSVQRFYRWRSLLGKDIIQFLPIFQPGGCKLFAQHVGVDLKKEIHSTSEAWIFDGIKLPHPRNKSDKRMFGGELLDIVFPSYFKHRFENFDRYCATVGNLLGDFSDGPYEYENVFLKEGDVVFDCGANIGLFSAVASRYGCQVFSFEAIPDIIDNYLSKTANMNGNIRALNFAVWDKEETLNFSLVVNSIGSSRHDHLLREKDVQMKRKQFAVPAIPLDAFVEKNGIERVDFIKADIEGAERNMLNGARRILKEFAPKLSICTYHLPDDPQVLREIILDANPKYEIVEKFSKMYAYVP